VLRDASNTTKSLRPAGRANLSTSATPLAAAVVVGLALGLLYGWVLRPVEYYDTAPDSLRIDYRVDYVLMVAEAYQAEGDAARALERLAALGPFDPQELLAQATGYASDSGFAREDLARLHSLADALLSASASPAIGVP
jgi:hypothetical protein